MQRKKIIVKDLAKLVDDVLEVLAALPVYSAFNSDTGRWCLFRVHGDQPSVLTAAGLRDVVSQAADLVVNKGTDNKPKYTHRSLKRDEALAVIERPGHGNVKRFATWLETRERSKREQSPTTVNQK